jgi:uncharacterized membrane protein
VNVTLGALLLVFGLRWLRKGVLCVAGQGRAVGQCEEDVGEEDAGDSDLPA